jgi:hypothetical protein
MTLAVLAGRPLGRSLRRLSELMGELEAERIGFQSVTESIDTTMLGGELAFQNPVPVRWKSPSDGSVDVNDALSRKSNTGGGN